MNKFEVYLTNGEVVNIEADEFLTNFENTIVRFIKDDRIIAIFALSNIYGFQQVDEFDDEDDDEG